MTQLNGERILVTGGSGFIGTNLVSELLNDNKTILNIDKEEPRCPDHKSVWKSVDLRSRENVFAVIREFSPTHIYHLGARTDLDADNVDSYSANTTGIANLIDASIDVGSVKRIIFASSRLVCKIGYQPKSYDDYCPTTAYGKSKVIGEQYVRGRGNLPFDWAIVRPTSIWGPWFDVPYRSFFDHVRAGTYVHPRKMKIFKSFGFVGNSVFQLRRLMDAQSTDISGNTFYIGDYEPIEIGGFAQKIAQGFRVRPPLSVPLWSLSCIALVGDLLLKLGYNNPPLTSFRLSNLKTEMIHNFEDISRITGPLPYSADQGIRLTINWMNNISKP